MDLKRLGLSFLAIIVAQFLSNLLLSVLGIYSQIGLIAYILVYSLIVSFLFTLISVRKGHIKEALKSPYFYREMCITFIFIFLLNVLL